MNFAVDGRHRDFFRKSRWIEFDELLSPQQLEIINREIKPVLASRLKTPLTYLPAFAVDKFFEKGRDLWRGAPSLKKILLSKPLAEAASELIEQKPLRFGYDQLFPSLNNIQNENQTYALLLRTQPTLQEISCIQGVLCGLMLCLKADPQKATSEDSKEKPTTVFSKTAGNGVIFSPELPIPFEELAAMNDSLYLLLVYTNAKAVYRMEERDPHVSDFKSLGYNFGDKLSDTLNPLVYS